MPIKFEESEMEKVGEIPSMFGGSPSPIFNYPVTPREAVHAFYRHDPVWQLSGTELTLFTPWIIADNIARAFVFDGTFVPGVSNQTGGKDMFGLDWTFVPEVGGSMTAPGNPLCDDANDLVEAVNWPDIDTWDWDKCKADNVEYIERAKGGSIQFMFLTGWFERLIAFMDFEGASIALLDEDQKPGVHAFFDKLTDFYISVWDRCLEVWPELDFFCIHDDWGSQKDTFFSPELVKEMIVPYMQRATEHLHSKGIICDVHSCGNNYKQVPNYIEAGWDSWTPQTMNDTKKIYEDFGEDIIVGVMPDLLDPETATDEEQRANAAEFVKNYCSNPKKLCTVNQYATFTPAIVPAWREELYRQSRIAFSK